MASERKDYTIFIWMILTYNTEATENKVQFLNFAYKVDNRDFSAIVTTLCNCLNWSKITTKQYTLFKRFLCDIE